MHSPTRWHDRTPVRDIVQSAEGHKLMRAEWKDHQSIDERCSDAGRSGGDMVVSVLVGLSVRGWHVRSRGLQLSMAWPGFHSSRIVFCESGNLEITMTSLCHKVYLCLILPANIQRAEAARLDST